MMETSVFDVLPIMVAVIRQNIFGQEILELRHRAMAAINSKTAVKLNALPAAALGARREPARR